MDKSDQLLANLKAIIHTMEKLLDRVCDHWEMEDSIYRFYHQSFKVYHIQSYTVEIVDVLKKVAPQGTELNPWFLQIICDGTGKVFKEEHNADWMNNIRPMMEAFFHAKYFLEMGIKYARSLDRAPNLLPSGWAALLYLYGLRFER